jgi:hypothetical protein
MIKAQKFSINLSDPKTDLACLEAYIKDCVKKQLAWRIVYNPKVSANFSVIVQHDEEDKDIWTRLGLTPEECELPD